jgi:pimeloyl-ACP methyl ester carboxylesterase
MGSTELKEAPRKFGRRGALLGIVSEPAGGSHGPALIVLNSGIIHRAGPCRLAVGITRAAALAGFKALRFDLSGIGDSEQADEDGTLEEIVKRDIVDAIDLMDNGSGVVLAGLCSGADNSFYVAADDPRVRGLVLIDPTVHRTRGFFLRKNLRRFMSPRSWWNILSGRSLYLRLREQHEPTVLPPGYYGLLTCSREEAVIRARRICDRGVKFLYVFTGGAGEYFNHPKQLLEAIPGVFSPDSLSVEWCPEMGHMLDRLQDRQWCENRITAFMDSVSSRIDS